MNPFRLLIIVPEYQKKSEDLFKTLLNWLLTVVYPTDADDRRTVTHSEQTRKDSYVFRAITTLDRRTIAQMPEFIIDMIAHDYVSIDNKVEDNTVVLFMLFDQHKAHNPNQGRISFLQRYKTTKKNLLKNKNITVEFLEHNTLMLNSKQLNYITYCAQTQSQFVRILREHELKTI